MEDVWGLEDPDSEGLCLLRCVKGPRDVLALLCDFDGSDELTGQDDLVDVDRAMQGVGVGLVDDGEVAEDEAEEGHEGLAGEDALFEVLAVPHVVLQRGHEALETRVQREELGRQGAPGLAEAADRGGL